MCGGGGPSGDTKYNWNDTLQPMWTQLLNDSTAQAYNNAYQKYPGQRIAGMDPLQNQAISDIVSMTNAGGTPAAIAGNNQAQGTAQGDFMRNLGGGQFMSDNAMANAVNPYTGYGPMFQQQLQGQLGDITNAYNQGTAADTAKMFALSGTYGGSAHQNAVANNEAMLGKTLAQATANAYQNQNNQSANLYEDLLNRGSQAAEAERNRQIQAISPAQNANNLFFQGTQALMGAGDANRSLNQDVLNMNYQDWLDQQNRPFQNADWLSGLYSRAQGGMSPNSTFNQAGYQASPFSSLLGAGLLGYAAMH